MNELQLGGGLRLDLSTPRVMGVLNVTPDSFSDGGHFLAPDAAIAQAREMAAAGADLIDIGGESTRPGARPVGVQEELDRVLPVIEALHAELPTPLSIDTSKPEVMRAAVAAGAVLVNDVYALRAPGALEAAAGLDAAVCLMHMQGEPRTMQRAPHYAEVVGEVGAFLAERARACRAAGIAADRLLLDPGFGFGKTLQHNLSLARHLPELAALGFPLLVGVSRKSMLGALLDAPPQARTNASVVLAALLVARGARIVRVHDVAPTVEALRLVQALDAAP